MSKGFDMLRDYIEHDALAMRRRKCCEFEYELQQEFAQLKAENDDLQELVRELYEFVENVDASGDSAGCASFCKHNTSYGGGCAETGVCWFERRMRELGIEVEE